MIAHRPTTFELSTTKSSIEAPINRPRLETAAAGRMAAPFSRLRRPCRRTTPDIPIAALMPPASVCNGLPDIHGGAAQVCSALRRWVEPGAEMIPERDSELFAGLGKAEDGVAARTAGENHQTRARILPLAVRHGPGELRRHAHRAACTSGNSRIGTRSCSFVRNRFRSVDGFLAGPWLAVFCLWPVDRT